MLSFSSQAARSALFVLTLAGSVRAQTESARSDASTDAPAEQPSNEAGADAPRSDDSANGDPTPPQDGDDASVAAPDSPTEAPASPLPEATPTPRAKTPPSNAAPPAPAPAPTATTPARAPLATPVPPSEEEIVVTGMRSPEASSSAIVATEVIRRREIEESGARNAAELLEDRSALQITQSFRGAELWLRGLDPEYTLILVDGDRVPGRVGGAIDLMRYPVENIQRVEIVRGGSSALYGADAIGGVVNLVTRRPTRPLEADAQVSAGQYGQNLASARVAGKPNDVWGLSVTSGYQTAEAYTRPGEVGTTTNQRKLSSFGAQITTEATEHHYFRLRGDYLRKETIGVDEGAGSAVFDRTTLQEQGQTALEHRLTHGDLLWTSRVTYSLFREQYLLDQRNAIALDSYEDNREQGAQVSSVVTLRLDDAHTTTLGAEYLHQTLDSERLTAVGQRSTIAVFAQDEWTALRHEERRAVVVPGVRFDSDSRYGQQLSPKLAVRIDATNQVVLRASYGHGFRAPSFQEQLMHFENPSVGYMVEGNPDLEAETARSLDAGLEWTPRSSFLLAASVFRNDLDDMIAVVTKDDTGVTGTVYTYDNINTAYTQGVESSLRLSPVTPLSITLGYTYLDTWDGEHDRPLEGRAPHRLSLSARLKNDTLGVTLTTRGSLSIGRQYYLDPDGDGIDETVVPGPLAHLDARLAKSLGEHFEVFAGVDNILDAGDDLTALLPRTAYVGAMARY